MSRRLRVALVGGLAVLAAAGCTTPPPDDPGPGAPCLNPKPVDFEKATVTDLPSTATSPRHRLTVSGEMPSVAQTVRLFPVVYIQQPEYWRIEAQTCDAAGAMPDLVGHYSVTYDFIGSKGTRGIEVAGKGEHTQRFDLVAPTRDPAFVGAWTVTGVSGGITGGIVPLPEGQQLSLVVKADGTLSGRLCNTYDGTWRTAGGSSLTIKASRTSTLPCPGPAIGQTEQRYLDALARVGLWRIEKDQLILSDNDLMDVVVARR
jgi:heat shock protein HslJ